MSRRLQSISSWAAVTVFCIGLLTLVGYLLKTPLLLRLGFTAPPLKAITGASFLMTGISLWLLQSKRAVSRPCRYIAWGCSSAVAIAGLITLAEYALGLDLGLDIPFLTVPAEVQQGLYLHRMAPYSAASFLLIGTALLLLDVKTPSGRKPANFLIAVQGVIVLVAFFGHAYSAPQFSMPSATMPPMSPQSLLAGFLSFIGLLLARPARTLLSIIESHSPGYLLVRRFLLPSLLVPFFLDMALLASVSSGILSERFADGVHAILQALFFILLIVLTADSLNKVDRLRRKAEETLRESHEKLESKVEERTKELQKSAIALEEERGRFSEVLDMLPAYVALITPDYHVPFSNRFFRERFGESDGRRCYEFLLGRNEPCEDCETFKALENNAPHQWEWTGPDGHNYQIHDFPFKDAGGSLLVLEMGIDITERKRAEAELQMHREHLEVMVRERTAELAESQERLLLAQEGAKIGVSDWNPKTDTMSWTPQLETMYGMSPGSVRTLLDWMGCIHPEDADRVRLEREMAIAQRRPFDLEFRVPLESGGIRWIEDKGSAIYADSGEAVRVFGIHIDITDRKLAEQAIESMARFPAENPNPVLRIAGDGSISYANEASETILERWGCSVGQVAPAKIRALVDEAIKKQWGREFEVEAGGRLFSLFFSPTSRDVNIYGLDVTERKRAEAELRESDARIRQTHELLETVTNGTEVIVAVLDTNLRYRFFNNAYKEEVKRLGGKEIHIGMSLEDAFSRMPTELQVAREQWLSTLGGGSSEYRIEFGGPKQYRRVYSVRHTPIRNIRGEVTGAGEVAFDITNQVMVEEELSRSRSELQGILDATQESVWLFSPNGEILMANPTALARIGLKESDTIGRNFSEFVPAELHESRMCRLREAVNTAKPVEFEDSRGGTMFHHSLYPVRDGEGRVASIVSFSRDITQSKRVELALRASEEKYRILFQNMAEGFALYELLYDEKGHPADWRILEVNDSYTLQTGISRDLIEGRCISEVFPDAVEEYLPRFARVVASKIPIEFDTYSAPAGRYLHVVTFPAGPDLFASTIVDISERKEDEETIRSSLKEKEVLLKELHHRVKNNLNVISTLLDLQAEAIDDPKALRAMRESRNRVKSIALVHEQLYQSENLAKVDFKRYISDLVSQLFSAYGTNEGSVTLEMDLDDLPVAIDTGIPFGLILNELVSNALKYAFPAGRTGILRIGLKKRDGGTNELLVSDDGIGLPEGLDFMNAESLGFQLVTILVRQLGGQIELVKGRGTTFRMTFEDMTRTAVSEK